MPSDVTVHQPGPRVVRLERKGEVAATWQEGYIATSRIVVLEVLGALGDVEGSPVLGEDDKVRSV